MPTFFVLLDLSSIPLACHFSSILHFVPLTLLCLSYVLLVKSVEIWYCQLFLLPLPCVHSPRLSPTPALFSTPSIFCDCFSHNPCPYPYPSTRIYTVITWPDDQIPETTASRRSRHVKHRLIKQLDDWSSKLSRVNSLGGLSWTQYCSFLKKNNPEALGSWLELTDHLRSLGFIPYVMPTGLDRQCCHLTRNI